MKKYRRTIPTIDDWVCHRHNVGLMLHKGRAKCMVGARLDECSMGWLTAREVQDVVDMSDQHFAVTKGGHVLRNLSVPLDPNDAHNRLVPEPDLSDPNVVRFWYLFGGKVPVSDLAAVVHAAGSTVNGYGPEEVVFIVVGLGPTLAHAEEVPPVEGTPIRDGISLGMMTGRHTDTRLDLLGSWTHEPTKEEQAHAASHALAGTIGGLLVEQAEEHDEDEEGGTDEQR